MNDIGCSELIESNLGVAEGVLKEAPHDIAVQANRRSGKTAFAQQILLECLANSNGWRHCSSLLGARLVPFWCDEPSESMQGKCVATSAAWLKPTILKVVSDMYR